jgi:transcriptional regulator with XRE-family HTH domain
MIDFPTRAERRIEAQRLLEGLSPQWVAERFGNSKPTVSLWKQGTRIPNLEDLLRLVVATGRPLSRDLHDRIFRTPATEETRPGEPERVTQVIRTESVSEEQSAVDATTAGLRSLTIGETPDHLEEDDLAGEAPPGEHGEEE